MKEEVEKLKFEQDFRIRCRAMTMEIKSDPILLLKSTRDVATTTEEFNLDELIKKVIHFHNINQL